MSKFYGTLISDKGENTRAGHRHMTATAQTFSGSVGVDLYMDVNSNFRVSFLKADRSAAYGNSFADVALSDLIEGKIEMVALTPEERMQVMDAREKNGTQMYPIVYT